MIKNLLYFFIIALALPAYAWAESPAASEKIQHIIVISLENHSFDNLFGQFPGADGIVNAKKTALQIGSDGTPYKTLPPVMDTREFPPKPDPRFPTHLANKPFPIERYVPASEKTGDLVHRFYEEQDQIHGGRMDRFASVSDAGALTMGYYDGSKTGLWRYAKKYTLADHFFHAAFGGSFLNHFWLICACTPRFDHAPDELVKRGSITEDGYAINTMFSALMHPAALHDTEKLLPPQNMPTIGDRLSQKDIDWVWYAGGWNDAMAGHPAKSFQFHHQPFAYFKGYDDHLKDEYDFLNDINNGTLPAVSFYKPLGEFDLHPGYTDIDSGDAHITEILKAIEKSPQWSSSVVIITFDENGGYWDHVSPPEGDRWGPGVRVPAIIVSPFARKNFVDHTLYDTTSILKFIETRFDLEPLGDRDAAANDLSNALEGL